MTLSPVLACLAVLAGTASAAPPARTADAETLLRRGQVPAALAAAEAEARATPHAAAAQELYVDLLVATGQRARAESEMWARALAAPADPDGHYLVGRAADDPAAAQAAYEEALRLDPDHARSHMGMGAVHEGRQRFEDALAAYTNATRRDRTLGEAWLGRTRSLLRLRRNPEALAVAREGLAAVPDEPALALLIAHLAPDEAVAVLGAAVGRMPDEPRLHEALGAALLEAGDAARALASARAALAIDGTAGEALLTEMFAVELIDGRIDGAAREELLAIRAAAPTDALGRADALAQRWPRSALVVLARGAARRATGDAAGSLADLVLAVKLDPTNVEAQAACGLALLDVGRGAEAEVLLSAASSARPWDASLGLARFRALRETGRGEEADRLLAQFATLHRYDPTVQASWATALVAAGRVEDAYRVVTTALLTAPDPRLAALFVQIAPAAGHPDEAAALLDQIVAATGNTALAEAARKLRAGAP